MDKREIDYLSKISRRNTGLLKNLLVTSKPLERQKYAIQEKLNRRNVDGSYKVGERERKYAGGFLNSDIYDKKKTEINEKVTKEIERRVEYDIQKGIKSGKLDPKRRDEWLKKRKL